MTTADPADRCRVVEGDITRLQVDAIVNAANAQLAPGGGVCGAIHAAAGPELAEACRHLGECPTGEARITPGFRLPTRFVIHAVGPVWQGGDANEDELLASCYRHALRLAREQGLQSIAFPAISTGIYGFPAPRAATIAVRTVLAELQEQATPQEVVFCCFGAASAALHREALAAERGRGA
ncbi:MAG TPA: O-acetyl-ADP-ribose deacetylase [Geminicoccaceae bacterium]|nr:O-acetyl-ADP-ribose deacetylase [Geminicoccaceae bacterium]